MQDVPKDVHMAIGEILGQSRALSSGVAGIQADFKEFRKETRQEQDKLSARLTAVEKFMWRSTGMAILASTALPILITVVGWMILK